jgi:hypothetical protein
MLMMNKAVYVFRLARPAETAAYVRYETQVGTTPACAVFPLRFEAHRRICLVKVQKLRFCGSQMDTYTALFISKLLYGVLKQPLT